MRSKSETKGLLLICSHFTSVLNKGSKDLSKLPILNRFRGTVVWKNNCKVYEAKQRKCARRNQNKQPISLSKRVLRCSIAHLPQKFPGLFEICCAPYLFLFVSTIKMNSNGMFLTYYVRFLCLLACNLQLFFEKTVPRNPVNIGILERSFDALFTTEVRCERINNKPFVSDLDRMLSRF